MTEKLQFAPGAIVEPQVFATEKSAAFAPPSETPNSPSAVPPELVNVTVRGELVLPTFWFAKLRLEVLKLATAGKVCG